MTTDNRPLATITAQLTAATNAYNPLLYLERANAYLDLGYPDLACGDAYRAVLLTDYVRDYSEEEELNLEPEESASDSGQDSPSAKEADEDEDEEEDEEEDDDREDAEEFRAATYALEHLRAASSTPATLLGELEESSMLLLTRCLLATGSVDETIEYCHLGRRRFPDSAAFAALLETATATPGSGGKARRFVYPWNTHEPDRFSKATVRHLNDDVVPRSSSNIEIRVVKLPLLGETAEVLGETQHLGMFATKDIAVGELCLREESALTVVTDPAEGGLCEYCGQRWRRALEASRPSLMMPGQRKAPKIEKEEEVQPENHETYTCDLCVQSEAELDEVVVPVWCSKHCRDSAMAKYHPALCSRPIAPFHRAAQSAPPSTGLTTGSQPGGNVYALLMMKAFAMALCQGVHPLDLEEVKYLYGVPPVEEGDLRIGWGWEENVRGAVGILEALGIDVFDGQWRPRNHPHSTDTATAATPEWWNTWVVNTLIAKFRGVASGRQDASGNTEAAAAHTLYSLTNHDCAPSAAWQCSGIVKFRGIGDGEIAVRQGEEVKISYCDVRLGYRERRAWMMGCLGGCCMCERCLSEERGEEQAAVETRIGALSVEA